MDGNMASENTQEQKLMENAFVNNNTHQPKTLNTITKIFIFIGNLCTYSILGAILLIIWKDTRPQDSKIVAKLSLIALIIDILSMICCIILTILLFIYIGQLWDEFLKNNQNNFH